MGEITNFFNEYDKEIIISLSVIGGLTILYIAKRTIDVFCKCSKCCI